MKRILLALIALLSIAAGFAQLQHVLPTSVQRFFDERSDRERLLKNNKPVDTYQYQFASSRMVNGVEMIDAFVDIDNVSAIPILRSHGVIVNSVLDGFVTAIVPVDQLATLTKIPGVTNVEVSRVVELCTDSTRSVTHAGQVLNGPDFGLPQAYDGTGVIIGIIDTGFDYRHLAFRCPDDTSRTRIVRVYDRENSTGHPVIIGNSQLSGSVFMGEQLDTMTYDTQSTHGTHTASIAAGTHVGPYGGMAPGADIVMCTIRNLEYHITETYVVDAIKYIYSYADSVGKPCVISMSISINDGSHDGNDRISKAVAQLTGPGRIFVISAGNSGNRSFYTHGPVTVEKPLNMLFCYEADGLNTDYTYYYKSLSFDTWVRDKGVRLLCKYHIFDKYTQRIAWESDLISIFKKIDSSEFSEFYGPDETVDNVGYMSALITQTSSGKFELTCNVVNLKSKSYTIDSDGKIRSRYQIGLSLYSPSLIYPNQPDSCYIDSWMSSGKRGTYSGLVYVDEIDENGDTISTQAIENFYQQRYDYCCINTYAVHDSVISAGAFIGRTFFYSLNKQRIVGYPDANTGGIYLVSAYEYPGQGPTGKHLPTIMAPGYYVVSAGSRNSYMNSYTHTDVVMRQDGYPWGAMSGTSMASPTVAGIIAQWLQIAPNLSPGDIKNIFSQTSIRDYYTNEPTYGKRFGPNGKIDAMAGVQYLLELMEDDILLGDVNGDGLITIRDVTVLISYLLSHDDSLGVVFLNADLNGDGILAIRDVTLLINLVLSGGASTDPV